MELKNAKGTRDYKPEEKILIDYIVNTLKKIFELYGYNPIETPILERYETLAAKFAAGEASDALKETFRLTDQGKRELGLRFDLTVPFARFIGMNPSIKMPFKKYMIGKVFRDGPIKTGRYREFMQVDPDIVGCESMVADAEIIAMAEKAFKELGISTRVVVNNRKVINGILESLAIPSNKMLGIIISIDKLDKVGKKEVERELLDKGVSSDKINLLLSLLAKEKNNQETIKKLKKVLKTGEGIEGLEEIGSLFDYLKCFGLKDIVFDPGLARGLAYYTGPIFEVFARKSSIKSSIAAGGRYDKLISNYLDSKEKFPATGISFGVDVIIEILKDKEKKKTVTKVFIIPIKTLKESLILAEKLRSEKINTDIDLIGKSISKNLDYADKLGIPYVIFLGSEEIKRKKYKLRNMSSGKEKLLSLKEIYRELK